MEVVPESSDSFLSAYVDDYAIFSSFNPDNKKIKQKMENDIGKSKTWMEEKQLKINDAKTEFIVLGTSNNLRKNTLDNIEIGKTKIHQTSKIKFLGVYLDEQLNLKEHIQNRVKKSNYNLIFICNIGKYININTTEMLLCTLVLSQLDYVNSILSRAPTTTLNHIKQHKTLQPE